MDIAEKLISEFLFQNLLTYILYLPNPALCNLSVRNYLPLFAQFFFAELFVI